jgi:hypothetical protein
MKKKEHALIDYIFLALFLLAIRICICQLCMLLNN